MDLKKAIDTIVGLERDADVNGLMYKDLCIWPLARLQLWARLSGPVVRDSVTVNKPSGEHNERGARRSTGLVNLCKKTLVCLGLRHRHWKGLKSLRQRGRSDVLLLSRTVDHSDVVKDKSYDRHIDPMKEFIDADYTNLKIELVPDGQPGAPRYYEPEYVHGTYYEYRQSVLQDITSWRDVQIEGYQELNAIVRDCTGLDSLDCNELIQRAERVLIYRDLFNDILRAVRPSAVFLVCYYYPEAMGLLCAARRLGIKTVDMQHGKQGKYHGMYTHWTKVPEQGYELLPDYFWLWGEESKENIMKWMPRESPHRAIVGGNRWLSDWIRGKHDDGDVAEKRFYEQLSSYDRVILVSLQPVKEPLPELLLEAMKASPKTWKWLVRLHPYRKHLMAMIAKRVDAMGATVEIEKATDLPLYALLRRSHYHVTAWSSVCYEALSFQVHTVIMDRTGRDLYKDYIRDGLFSYAESGQEIIEVMQKNPRAFPFDEPIAYIETSDSIAREAVSAIL